jgi:hypothetical protein
MQGHLPLLLLLLLHGIDCTTGLNAESRNIQSTNVGHLLVLHQ